MFSVLLRRNAFLWVLLATWILHSSSAMPDLNIGNLLHTSVLCVLFQIFPQIYRIYSLSPVLNSSIWEAAVHKYSKSSFLSLDGRYRNLSGKVGAQITNRVLDSNSKSVIVKRKKSADAINCAQHNCCHQPNHSISEFEHCKEKYLCLLKTIRKSIENVISRHRYIDGR